MACSGADDLYGVLRDSSAQLMPSEAIMNQIYGSAGSVDGPADDMSQQIASSELYRQRVGWDHGPAFSIAE
ncbi:hypothetical protein EC988_008417 [Linderina pennispora]|nr:hypothetical protein EC988_008417 [Linderina pennispora]